MQNIQPVCKKRNQPEIFGFRLVLARQKGFEPPTFRLGGGCSIQLSYWRMDTSIIMENRVGVKGVGM